MERFVNTRSSMMVSRNNSYECQFQSSELIL